MIKRIIALSILAAGCGAVAHADSISGFFNANGTDSFTSSTITFDSAQVAGALGGTFATYLTDGNPITFLPGALPYSQGVNTPPNPPFTSGTVPLFTTTENGATFTFNMSSYDAGFINNGTNGCLAGSTCLDVTGDGFFTATGAVNGTSGPAEFVFTSQYTAGQTVGGITTFSASADATALPPTVPEPASLALVGSGILAIAGLARRKFAV